MTVAAQRVAEFDLWRPHYGGATVEVRRPNSTTLLPVYYDSGSVAGGAQSETRSVRWS